MDEEKTKNSPVMALKIMTENSDKYNYDFPYKYSNNMSWKSGGVTQEQGEWYSKIELQL